MLKIKIALSAIVLASFFTFVSCSEDEKSQVAQNEQTTSENLDEFIVQYVENKLALHSAFSENLKAIPSVSKIAAVKKTLSNIKNEDELIIALKNAGIKNAPVVVNLAKQLMQIENDFRAKNSYFYSLDINQRQRLVDSKLDSYLLIKKQKGIEKTSKISTTNPCVRNYNTDVSDCNGDYLRCGTFAVLSAAAGIYPGVVAAVYCMWDFSDCKSDAIRDYNTCTGG